MRREETEREALRLNRERTRGSTHRWVARAYSAGEWSLVMMARPVGGIVGSVKATIEAKPRPPQPDGPRPND